MEKMEIELEGRGMHTVFILTGEEARKRMDDKKGLVHTKSVFVAINEDNLITIEQSANPYDKSKIIESLKYRYAMRTAWHKKNEGYLRSWDNLVSTVFLDTSQPQKKSDNECDCPIDILMNQGCKCGGK